MDVSNILSDLNENQRQVVAAQPSNLLVLAGAGSGKTRVLVHRIAWLVCAENIPPHQILAVTFTNKAAKEMRARIDELLGISHRGLWVGTFHGIAHRLLKAHWQEAGLPQNFQILDADDQLRLLKRIYQEQRIDDGRWPVKQAQWFINGQKDEGRRAQYIDAVGDRYLEVMQQIYLAYEAACERSGLVDFGEILLRSHEIWLKNPRLLTHYQERFRYILVDEFQDTNTVQYAWLRMLLGKSSYITVVGDDDQSIYGWRGAKIENIQQFSADFPQVSVIRLEQNYRSTATILKAANAIIAHNHDRLGKELWTEGDDGEPISLYVAYNEVDEANFVVERILDWVDQGNQRNEVAVLYRSNAQSRVLEEALIARSVPYRIYGGHRFYDRLEIKNALAYLRLTVNHHDDGGFERIVNVPTRGIGNKTVDTVRLFAREHQCSMWQAAEKILQQNALSARACNALRAYLEMIETMANNIQGLELHKVVSHVVDVSGLIEHHGKEKGEKAQTRVENLKELITASQEFANQADIDGADSLVDLFLDSAALDAGESQADQFEDSVQLMTLHSAKGLEFPQVFLVGVEENLFPHKMSVDEPGGLAEERRLCYVGITRAMQKLTVTYAETRRLYGNDSFNAPSRFIREIPKELLQEVRLHGTASPAILPTDEVSEVDENGGIYVGQRVKHQMFGVGVVLHCEGSGPQARVQVNFDDEGSKWLVLQYAKLEVA